MAKPDLETWNFQVLMLTQALQGAVSPNFRRVGLSHDGARWYLSFVLENEESEDLEEIEEIVLQYESFQEHQIDLALEVQISTAPLADSPVDRVVYQRREY